MTRYTPAGESDFESGSEESFEFFGGESECSNLKFADQDKKNSGEFLYDCNQITNAVKTTRYDYEKHSLSVIDLQNAVISGNVKAVSHCVDEIKNPDVLLSSGWTALMYASYFAQIDIVKILIDKGASITVSSSEGATALHIACRSPSNNAKDLTDCVKCLLNSGATISSVDNIGKTPLMYAASRGNMSEVLLFLLQQEDNESYLGIKDEKEWTAGDWAAVYGQLENLKILLDAGIEFPLRCSQSRKIWSKNVLQYTTEEGLDKFEEEELDDKKEGEIMQKMSSDVSSVKNHDQTSSITSESPTVLTANPEIESLDLCMDPNRTEGIQVGEQIKENLVASDEPRTELLNNNNYKDCENLSNFAEFNIPVVIRQQDMKVESYETYGQLELFLLGLELSSLIPLFKDQDISFEQLICLTMKDLEIIGVAKLGARKRILEAHSQSTVLPDYTTTVLTSENMISILNSASNEVHYYSSCLRYIKQHIEMYPQVLQPTGTVRRDEPPVTTLKDKLNGILVNIHKLSSSLKSTQQQVAKVEKETHPTKLKPADMIEPTSGPQLVIAKKNIFLLGVSLFCVIMKCIHRAVK